MKPKSWSQTETQLSQSHQAESRKSSSTRLETQIRESHGYLQVGLQDPRKPSTQLSQFHGNLQVGLREARPNDTPESRYQTAENTPNLQPDNSDNHHHRHYQHQQQVGAPADHATSFKRDRDQMVRALELGIRLSAMVLCLVSFSVMATDKTQGWSGDSFDRYKEYKYCVSVNVIGFVYSGFQACDMAYRLVGAKRKGLWSRHHLRSHFDYLMDQIMAYVLISASSSAATRVIDWESNWGRDEFTEKASASIGMAFLGFIAFAFSSLFSLFNLGTPTTTTTFSPH